MKPVRGLAGLGLALGMLVAMPATAKEGDTFRPFVSYARYYDSNLFRLDEGGFRIVLEDGVPEVVTKDSASDHYGVLTAGLNLDWRPGRQRITALASQSRVRFSRYSSLDYDGSDYQLKWAWQLGNRLSGQIGATETVTQSSFADFYSLEAVNNEVTRDTQFATAGWQFHPRWNVGLGAAAVSSTNSTLLPNDYEDTSMSATLGYATPKGSKLRGQLRRVDGEYPNRLPPLFADRLYTQTEYNLLGDWNVEGKLIVRGKLGYVRRENDTLSERDFSGLAGRVSADYSLSAKTMLNWAIYQEIANSDDRNASYQLNTGTSIGAAWLATSKITLRANARIENRSFEGDTGITLPGVPQREEDRLDGSLSLSYAPVRMATIDIGVQAGRRDSNVPGGDYRFRSAFVSVRADF